MKNNPKILIILCVIGFILIFGIFWIGGQSPNKNKQVNQSESDHQAFDVASGDTNNEVLKSIVARQKTLQDRNEQQAALIKKLQLENQVKTQKNLQKEKRSIQNEITKTTDGLKQSFNKELNELKQKSTSSSIDSHLEYPLSDGNSERNSHSHIISSVPDLSSLFIKENFSSKLEKKSTSSSMNLETPSLPSDAIADFKSSHKNKVPYYTIPDGATVANATLLSPLIGEVPVNSELKSPAFPFKAILSYRETQNMFSANGIPLPQGIVGTILQGYSVGNMSLGCARPYVTKILFVFHDGHFVVFPKDKGGESNNATQIYPKNAIGYLSDAYNNPCITGRYITDAPKVIASLMGFGAAVGVGGAIAQAQTQTLTNISQGTTGTVFTGNLGKYAGGLALSAGAKDALDWYQSRVNDIFDAVFVPSTFNGRPRKLIFNVTQTIPIDLNKLGRTLSYENSSQMSATDHSLQ